MRRRGEDNLALYPDPEARRRARKLATSHKSLSTSDPREVKLSKYRNILNKIGELENHIEHVKVPGPEPELIWGRFLQLRFRLRPLRSRLIF
jgi:hypothetical protein